MSDADADEHRRNASVRMDRINERAPTYPSAQMEAR